MFLLIIPAIPSALGLAGSVSTVAYLVGMGIAGGIRKAGERKTLREAADILDTLPPEQYIKFANDVIVQKTKARREAERTVLRKVQFSEYHLYISIIEETSLRDVLTDEGLDMPERRKAQALMIAKFVHEEVERKAKFEAQAVE